MLHHGHDVFLEEVRHLVWRELALSQPIRIVVVPNQTMTADFHPVSLSEADNLVAFGKVECARNATDRPPLHSVFRFDHIELTGKSDGVSGFRKHTGTNCRAHQEPNSVRGLP